MSFHVLKTIFFVCFLLYVFVAQSHCQTNSSAGWFWTADAHERSVGLPRGVPRLVDTNGNIDQIDLHFSSAAYAHEAARLMLQEANHAAQALHLEEDLPLVRSKNAEADAAPFGFFYTQGLLGNVATTNYIYRFMSSGKLDHIEIQNSEDVVRDYQDTLLPENQMNNQAASQLATQWLSSLSVDIKALNRDCQLTVASSPVLNYVQSGNQPIRRLFTPTYDVEWKSSNGPAAYVQLYLPDKVLIQLSVDDPKYNLRPPLIFTNLAALFPGNAVIKTNYPVTPTILGSLWSPPFSEVTFVTDSNQPEPAFHDLPLSRWIQTQTSLNTNRLSLTQLMTLKPISGPDEWGVAMFELPIPFNALNSERPLPGGDLRVGSLDTNGNFIEATFDGTEKAPDGNAQIYWNINWGSPGWHQLRARLEYYHGMDGDQFDLIGPPLTYYSSNTCQFYEDSTLFTSDGADLYAKLRETTAKFRVKVTSRHGRLINDISGETTNGEINLAWDLTSLDGTIYTNNSFIGSFYVTYPDDTQTNPPVKAQFCKIGTSCD